MLTPPPQAQQPLPHTCSPSSLSLSSCSSHPSMAKEEDLKRVDLKVTVNCCEGCKRKVMKALSIKGVLKTEIHPTLPKVTVVGNFDTKTLVKKLAKIGKNAEIILQKEEKKTDGDGDKEKPKEANCCENKSSKGKEKKTEQDDTKKDKSSSKEDKEKDKSTENDKESSVSDANKLLYPSIVTAMPQMSYAMSPSIVQGYANPVMLPPMPYYAMNGYAAPLPYAYRDNYYFQPPPPPQPPHSSGFGDYFNDENTAGCHVM